MPELSNTQLVESLASALETTAFVSVMPPDEPVMAAPEDALLICAEFSGARCGRIELIAPQSLGRLLVENTVGVESEDGALPNIVDPLIELVNITCGMLLKQLTPHKRVEMSVPFVEPFDRNAWPAFSAGADVLMADGHVVAIRVCEK